MKALQIAIVMLGLATPVSAQTSQRPEGDAIYAGNYRMTSGEIVGIAQWALELDPEAPKVLCFTNFQSGRFGILTPSEHDVFTAGPGLMVATPPDVTIAFERAKDGRITALTYEVAGQTKMRGTRLAMKREEVSFESKGKRLNGILLLPSSGKRTGAVVLVPAATLGRYAAATFPNFFLSQGLAVLTYDRRSNPGLRKFEDFADDAIAAVDYLRARKEIDPAKVGLWGHSQGGWLSLLAASRSKHVGFVVNHSGMLVPAWKQELYRLRAESEADGAPREEVAEEMAFAQKVMDVARTGQGWDELEKEIAKSKGKPWFSKVYAPASREELQRVWDTDFSFDPGPHVRRVSCPVLGLFGALDKSTPLESADILKRELQAGGNADFDVRIFPNANHAFFESKTGGNKELLTLNRFAPGMFEAMRSWLKAHLR